MQHLLDCSNCFLNYYYLFFLSISNLKDDVLLSVTCIGSEKEKSEYSH